MIKYLINEFDVVSIYPQILRDTEKYHISVKDGKISFDLRKYPRIITMREVLNND